MSGNPLGLGDDVLAAIDGVSLAEWAKFYQAAELKPLPKKAGYKFPSVDWQPYAWPRTGEELFDRPRAVRTPLEEAEHSGALPPRGEYETCSPPGVQNGTVSVSGWVVNRLGVPRVSSDIHTSEPSSSSWIQIPVRALRAGVEHAVGAWSKASGVGPHTHSFSGYACYQEGRWGLLEQAPTCVAVRSRSGR